MLLLLELLVNNEIRLLLRTMCSQINAEGKNYWSSGQISKTKWGGGFPFGQMLLEDHMGMVQFCKILWGEKIKLTGQLIVICARNHILRNKTAVGRVDNAGSVRIFKKGYSTSCKLWNTLVKTIHQVTMRLNIRYCMEKITGNITAIATTNTSINSSTNTTVKAKKKTLVSVMSNEFQCNIKCHSKCRSQFHS